MQKIFLIIIITFSGIYLKAQSNLDSLFAIWLDPDQTDSLRVAAYKNYIWKGFLYSRPDTAFMMSDDLIYYGLEKNYLKAQAIGYNTKGVSWYMRGDYPKALGYHSQSVEIFHGI